ncbi:hypothetical protein RJ641_002685 [Dillenia turbinata]|uniref:Uncharacterized protein n=1 Tax=Dillenia turbinata TaxID=194707 RepID=A0AAN8VK39_9MAGN
MGSGHCGENAKVVEIQVEVISKDTIKPSSPTPHHLRNLKLSFLDQIQPPVLMPMVFFYPKESNYSSSSTYKAADPVGVLKKSLSEVLTWYYPLSGRVFDNLYVDCSDQGVPFIEAHANCHLSEVVPDPVPCELNKLLPFKLEEVEDFAMGIQVTSFDCGGMALAVCTSHKLADAWSIFQFVGSWAKTAALGGLDQETPLPKFKMAEFFPAINISGFQPTTGVIRNTSNISIKRFVFSSSAINFLRNKYAKSLKADFSHRPTRAEALSTFIWSRFMATTQPKPTRKIYSVQHAVNLRTRVNPPLSDNYFGNIIRLATTIPEVDIS